MELNLTINWDLVDDDADVEAALDEIVAEEGPARSPRTSAAASRRSASPTFK